MVEPSNQAAGCFWQADFDEAAASLLEVIRAGRPKVMVSYHANGFYGTPEHIEAHRVEMRACEKTGGLVRKMSGNTVPEAVRVGMVERRRGRDPAERPAGGTGYTEVQFA